MKSFKSIVSAAFLIVFISVNAFAQKRDSINYYSNKITHEIFTGIDSTVIGYQEFYSTGNLKQTGKILRYVIWKDQQIEDTITHMFVLVADTMRNVKTGLWTEYYPGGKKRLEYNFDSSGDLNGQYSAWYENGQTDSAGNLLSNNFLKSGTWLYYYETGITKRKETFLD